MAVLIRRGLFANLPTLAVGELGLATDTGQVYVGTATGNELVGGSVADGDYGDIVVSGGGAAWTIDAGVVTFAKMQAVSANILLGNDASGTTVEEIACTAAARTVLDDATVGDMVNTLGGASSTGTGGLARATSPTLVTPLLGTPTSGTLTNCTGLPIAGLVASTSTAIGVGSIELGHASDTTITRASAGQIAVEGVNVVMAPGATSIVTVGTLTTGATGAGFTIALATSTVTGTLPVANLTTLSGLTAADVGLTDAIAEYNAAAAANRSVTAERIGGFFAPHVCQGRLTVTTGDPAGYASTASAGTIYFAPYVGDRVALYDGTRWKLYQFTERSLALSVSADNNYDVFLYDNAGTLTLELSNAWSTATARADALATQDGVLVKSGATTRRYLGTIRASGSNVTADSTARRLVWNYYNRLQRHLSAIEATDTWTYTTAAYQLARVGGTTLTQGTNSVDYVCGWNEDEVVCEVRGGALHSATTVNAQVGVGVDSTSTNSAILFGNTAINTMRTYPIAIYRGCPGLGYHYLAWLERSTASGTTTWIGDNGTPTEIQCGMVAEVWG